MFMTGLPTLLVALAAAHLDGEGSVRFNRDIRPILSNHCFECHGPDAATRKADMRLDQAEGLLLERDGRRIVVPGEPESSELATRILAADSSERMPPADFRHQLSAEDRQMLVRWISEGAEVEPHWAYVAPRRAASGDWARGVIDASLARAMRTADVASAPQADRRTLARRLAFDLTGLPPLDADVAAFVGDTSADAYERYVERQLASPHHGERMALFWLDLVRYADTVGYHGDQEWRVWPYRDWVIRAFNENMPFDQFTIEQLAGDLLPDATIQQRVASGYNRLNMVTFEGGSQPKEFLLKYAADRVRTVSSVWLGSTVGCAECHDHKFDPFSTRDFYALSAYFADIQEQGVYTRFAEGDVPPEMAVPSAEQEAQLEDLSARADTARAELERRVVESGELREAWERELTQRRAELSEPVDVTWIDDAQDAGGKTSGTWDFVGADVLQPESGEKTRRQRGSAIVQHFFDDAERRVTLTEGDSFFAWVRIDPADPPETLMLQFNDGSWEHRAYWGEDKIAFGSIGSETPAHHHMGPLPAAGEWARLEVDSAAVGLAAGTAVDGMAFTQFGGTAYWDRAGVRTTRPGLVIGGPPAAVLEAIASESRTDQQDAVVRDYWREAAPELAAERVALATVEQEREALEASIPRTLVAVSIEPRPVRVLARGDWMDESGELVEPATPHFLPALARESGGRQTRLDLARWLVAPENPLTARVLVNRLWRLFYGEGLVRSVDDLGSQGAWPDHLELLDSLALDLVESGWDVRAMIRRMVSSQAYRQSSAPRPELDVADPEGRLFAQQARRRLDAEFIRDVALSASGLLVPTIGGESVKPYQPEGYWRELNFPMRRWQHDKDERLYRRGMYTFWCRTFLHPTMKVFDAPPREECTAARPSSNTPLQALALLNDPAFVEAARILAERVLSEPGDDAVHLEQLMRRVLQRAPRAAEAELLHELLASQRESYRAEAEAARSLTSNGELAPSSDVDTEELAAWTSLARAVLNMQEAITRR